MLSLFKISVSEICISTGVLKLVKRWHFPAFVTKVFVGNQWNIFSNVPCRLSSIFFYICRVCVRSIVICISSEVNICWCFKKHVRYIYWIKVALKRSLEAHLKITLLMNWPQSQLSFFVYFREVRINEIYCFSNPYALSLAISKLRSMQSNALEMSVKTAPVSPPISRVLRHFSTITKRQCCALKPYRNPHWNLENVVWKYG